MWHQMRHSTIFSAAALAALTPSIVQAQTLVSGIGRVEDGDTLLVGEKKVRLFGVDAPEFDQSCSRGGQAWDCGAEAADALMRLATGKQVECISIGTDRYDRVLGRCAVD